MSKTPQLLALGGVAIISLGALYACSGETPSEAPAVEEEAPAAVEEAEVVDPMANPELQPLEGGPYPTILMSQAQFVVAGREVKPGPAKLVLWRMKGEGDWEQVVIEDPGSNVFHKAMPWEDGLLTIGAEQARLKYWHYDDGWQQDELWMKEWGGKFNRLRDLEVADVNGDGVDEMVLATHDMGVVAVGTKGADGWSFIELDEQPDTFVHEVEVGDVDGDGKTEFYVTPSDRNRASGESQPGGVARYDFDGETYVKSEVVMWEDSHAKEILVADLDGKGDALYAVKEGVSKKEGGKVELVEGVRIIRLDKGADGYTQTVVAELDDHQTRFLVPGDVDGDGAIELVAAGYKTGLWVLQPDGDGTFTPELIDKNSGGFEHAVDVADLDGDGSLEIYVASDKQKQFRRYRWDGSSWARTVIGELPDNHITWNLQHGSF